MDVTIYLFQKIKKLLKLIPIFSTSLTYADALWTFKNLIYKLSRIFNFFYLSKHSEETIVMWNVRSDIDFTFSITSRKIDNRDSNLKKFLDSIVTTSIKSRKIEVILKVDSNDSLIYYQFLLRKYDFKIVLVISPQSEGYWGVHQMHSRNFELSQGNSKIFIIATDDSILKYYSWDRYLINKYETHLNHTGHNYALYFPSTLSKTIRQIVGVDGERWIAGADFPIISRNFLELLKEIIVKQKWETWTLCGNLPNVDSYFADILRQLPSPSQKELHVKINDILIRTGKTSYMDIKWPLQRHRYKKRLEMLNKFNSATNENRRNCISLAVRKSLIGVE